MDFITGALVALVASVVIPFITSQFSLWSERRQELTSARQAAVASLVSADASTRLSLAEQIEWIRQSGQGGSSRVTEVDNATVQVAYLQLLALFTTSDHAVRDAFVATSAITSGLVVISDGMRAVLATWAAGRDIRARLAARRLLKQDRQNRVGHPEDHGSSKADH